MDLVGFALGRRHDSGLWDLTCDEHVPWSWHEMNGPVAGHCPSGWPDGPTRVGLRWHPRRRPVSNPAARPRCGGARGPIHSECIYGALCVPPCVWDTPGPRQLMETEMATNPPTSLRLTVAGRLAERRRRQPPLEAALASGDPDDIPRAAGLLGDLFVKQSQSGAAEHAYRAAIDADHPYWTPVAQVALAQLLSDRGDGDEARALLEDAIASGHPRTASLAQASLTELSTGDKGHAAVRPSLDAYETLSDSTSANRSQVVGDATTRASRGPDWARACAGSQAPNGSSVGSGTPRRPAAARKARKSALAGLIGLAAGIAALTVLVSELGAETPVATAAERREPERNEDRIVRHQIDRIASSQISTEEFVAIADMRVADDDWTQDMVDRVVDGARTRNIARLYQGCQVYSAGRLTARLGC